MIRRVMQCETCGKQVDLHVNIDVSHYYGDMPATWFTLVAGNPQTNTPWHFCSISCLDQWCLMRLSTKKASES